jgi:hypothetical protein
MLRQLSEDQAYRARWQEERSRRYSRWQRIVAFACATAGATVVVASGCVQLIHLF